MFTCSVSTLLFNANPLMKFDGYYMLSDALEVPNLKQKSGVAATTWAQRYLLGLRFGGPAQFFSYELSPLVRVVRGGQLLLRVACALPDLDAPFRRARAVRARFSEPQLRVAVSFHRARAALAIGL